jgi:putative ABC transport system permease protein
VVITAADYLALGGHFEATDLALWPRPARKRPRALAARAGRSATASNGVGSGEIRELSLSIFDKSFAVTYALEAAAMLIGLFGLAVTLAASVWLRARELATLAALGFDRAMLTRAVMLEGALIAASACCWSAGLRHRGRRHPDPRGQSAGLPLAHAAAPSRGCRCCRRRR